MKWIVVAVLAAACGAQQVKVAPVKIEPIHITVDVNIKDTPKTDSPKIEPVGQNK